MSKPLGDALGDEVDRIHGWRRWSPVGDQARYRDAIAEREGRLYVRVGEEERLMWAHPWLGVGHLCLEGDQATLVRSGPCLDCKYPSDWHYPDWIYQREGAE